MRSPDHYEEAVRLAHESYNGDDGDEGYRLRLAAVAQVHAVLALVDQLGALIGVRTEPTVGPACLWCGRTPAPEVVLGDPLCAGCYREHRTEVDS